MAVNDELLTAFLRRSYHSVDGLWFVMTEAESNFEAALELDRKVWEVMAKIQARTARSLLDVNGNKAADLAQCLSLKLEADGHDFDAAVCDDAVVVTVRQCPWLTLLEKSDRAHLAQRVAQVICPTEGAQWSAEFGGEWQFELPRRACAGAQECELRFTRIR